MTFLVSGNPIDIHRTFIEERLETGRFLGENWKNRAQGKTKSNWRERRAKKRHGTRENSSYAILKQKSVLAFVYYVKKKRKIIIMYANVPYSRNWRDRVCDPRDSPCHSTMNLLYRYSVCKYDAPCQSLSAWNSPIFLARNWNFFCFSFFLPSSPNRFVFMRNQVCVLFCSVCFCVCDCVLCASW